MTRQQQLNQIAKEIVSCNSCKIGKSGKAVPGEGSANADVVFIGEAPGKQEALTGRPFIGRSGKLLRSQIRAIGLSENEVYITSPVKYLPDKGTPSKMDIMHGRMHLQKQLAVINPKIIVLLGNTAIQGVLDEKLPISKRHGTTIERNGKLYFLMYHPAAAVRIHSLIPAFTEDFQTLQHIVR